MSCAYDRKSFLEAFGGWEWRADWGDVTFMTEHSKDMGKIAIVGDEKWKDDAFAFTAKGFRYRHRVFYSVTLGGSKGLAELVAAQSRSRRLGRSGALP
jgi:stage II sporulation SpoAA-like protein